MHDTHSHLWPLWVACAKQACNTETGNAPVDLVKDKSEAAEIDICIFSQRHTHFNSYPKAPSKPASLAGNVPLDPHAKVQVHVNTTAIQEGKEGVYRG